MLTATKVDRLKDRQVPGVEEEALDGVEVQKSS